MRAKASRPPSALATCWPSWASQAAMDSRMASSSSTTKTRSGVLMTGRPPSSSSGLALGSTRRKTAPPPAWLLTSTWPRCPA